MLKETKKVILVGFGNEYRRDDGLGLKLLDLIEDDRIKKIKVQELSYSLLDDIKDFDIVIFIDASIEGESINFRKIEKINKFSPLTHHLTPEELLIWAEFVNKKSYDFYLLSIRGYDFDFGEELSEDASKNLKRGAQFLIDFLNSI
ncbi:MAG: hydrogenase maturation protease [Caldisericia bacterium]|nr:hydrogenase maturation protease [Caldisericia bacterium]